MADTTVKAQTEGQDLNGANVATIAIEDLYNKDKFDMSTMETDNIFQLLKTSESGLTTAEAEARVAKVKMTICLFACIFLVCLSAWDTIARTRARDNAA